MKEAGEVAKFQKNLDPQAQEFRPRNPSSNNQIGTPFQPHICYAYPFSYVSTPVMSQPSLAAGTPLPPAAPGPTRVVLLSCVPTDVSEAAVRMEMEGFGEVGAVEMERLRDGIVIVHFYDLRHAEEAVMEIQEQYMQQQSRLRRFYEYDAMLFGHLGVERQSLVVPVAFPARGLIAGRAVWAQFSAPESTTPTPDGHNQGTLVISNLDSKLSASKLKEIVQNFGHVKEFREMTPKQQKWFVEFFDTRDAARALSELDGKEIYDKKLIIKFSCSGGYGRIKSSTAAATATTSYNDINSRKIIHSRTALCPPHVTGGILQSCRSSSVASSASVHLSQALLPTKRPTFRTENSSRKGIGRSNCGSIAPISSLSLGEDGSECTKSSGKFLRKVNYSHQKVPTVKQPRKRGQKNPDSHFLINVDAIAESNSRDTRTTVMIKNIPNKYSQKLLLNMLDNHCILSNENITGDDEPLSSYDFVYLPIDFQ